MKQWHFLEPAQKDNEQRSRERIAGKVRFYADEATWENFNPSLMFLSMCRTSIWKWRKRILGLENANSDHRGI